MADFDTMAPNFRRARDLWPTAQTLSDHYDAMITCYTANQHGLVEYIKSFVESVCVTILVERGQPLPSAVPDTTVLLVAALASLDLKNTRGANKLDKALSGFNKLADALSEMRNETGPIAHGKDGFLDRLIEDHLRAFVIIGDSILGVLLAGLEGTEPDLVFTREDYDHFIHLHERIDSSVAVEAEVDLDDEKPMVVVRLTTSGKEEEIELRLEPSRLLYGVDREVYKQILASSAAETFETEEAEAEIGEGVSLPTAEPAIEPEPEPVVEAGPEYSGRLDSIRVTFIQFLVNEGVSIPEGDEGNRFVDSLLAGVDIKMGIDWRARETLLAGMKVDARRILIQFGIEPGMAEGVAEKLVTWLRIQAPADPISQREGDAATVQAPPDAAVTPQLGGTT